MNDIIPQDAPQFKQCYACAQRKPATPEFFVRNKRYPDGLNYKCKECVKAYLMEDHTKEEIPEGHKRCTKCTNLFLATTDFFYNDKSKPDGLNPVCKKCTRVRGKAYDDAHAEEKQQYYQEHREERRAYKRQYQIDRKEQLRINDAKRRATNQEAVRERERRYRSTPQGMAFSRAANQRRKAIKKAIPGTLTVQEIQAKLKSQKHKCYYAACGYAKFKKNKGRYVYHIEHVVPVSRTEHNPRHDIDNIVLACPTCNLRKNDKLPHEWPEGGRLF